MQLNSESVLKGAERAPNRSLFYALGYTDEEINRGILRQDERVHRHGGRVEGEQAHRNAH